MPEKHLYEYAVIRIVPLVEREEFLNVGVILHCRSLNFLGSQFGIDEARLAAFAPAVNVEEVRRHLAAIEKISKGGEKAGPIGALPTAERFRWLTAPRSTIVQTSATHVGLTCDPIATLSGLMQRLVEQMSVVESDASARKHTENS